MAFFWPCGHEGQTFFDLLAKIQARRIKRSNDWGKTLFFKKNLVLFIVELSVIFFSTLIFSTLNTTLNSTLDTLMPVSMNLFYLCSSIFQFSFIGTISIPFAKQSDNKNENRILISE